MTTSAFDSFLVKCVTITPECRLVNNYLYLQNEKIPYIVPDHMLKDIKEMIRQTYPFSSNVYITCDGCIDNSIPHILEPNQIHIQGYFLKKRKKKNGTYTLILFEPFFNNMNLISISIEGIYIQNWDIKNDFKKYAVKSDERFALQLKDKSGLPPIIEQRATRFFCYPQKNSVLQICGIGTDFPCGIGYNYLD